MLLRNLPKARLAGRRLMSGFSPEEHAHCKASIVATVCDNLTFFIMLAASTWKRYSVMAVGATAAVAAWTVIKEMRHESHHHEAVAFPYLTMRTKDFPWDNRKWYE